MKEGYIVEFIIDDTRVLNRRMYESLDHARRVVKSQRDVWFNEFKGHKIYRVCEVIEDVVYKTDTCVEE